MSDFPFHCFSKFDVEDYVRSQQAKESKSFNYVSVAEDSNLSGPSLRSLPLTADKNLDVPNTGSLKTDDDSESFTAPETHRNGIAYSSPLLLADNAADTRRNTIAKSQEDLRIYYEQVLNPANISVIQLSGFKDVNEISAALITQLPTDRFFGVDISDNSLDVAGIRSVALLLNGNTRLVTLNAANNIEVSSYLDGIIDASCPGKFFPFDRAVSKLIVSTVFGEIPAGSRFLKEVSDLLIHEPGPELVELNISSNWIRAQGACELLPALHFQTRLTALNLSRNNLFDSGLAMLEPALIGTCTNLRSLDVSVNWIGSAGAAVVARVMSHNPHLTALSLARNGLASDGVRHIARAFGRGAGPSLANLDLEDNNLDELAPKCLVRSALGATALTRLVGLESGTTGPFFGYLMGLHRGEPAPPAEHLRALDLSGAGLRDFPEVVLQLTCLERLDVSRNRLSACPFVELCGLATLASLDCAGNPGLLWPPAAVARTGGPATMAYIRDALAKGRYNTEVLLFAIGPARAGKSALLAAVSAADGRCAAEYQPTPGVAVSAWVPAGQEGRLRLRAYDLGGLEVYGTMRDFILTAGVILLVWPLLPPGPCVQSPEEEEGSVRRRIAEAVEGWAEEACLCAPGATVLLVATCASGVVPLVEAERQCRLAEELAAATIARLRDVNAVSGGAAAVQLALPAAVVDSATGMGVSDLVRRIVDVAKARPEWGTAAPEEAGALLAALEVERTRAKAVVLGRAEFLALAAECGLREEGRLVAVVKALHNTLRLRCVASPKPGAAGAGGSVLAGLRAVYLDVLWCTRVLAGALRHERVGLLAYFGGSLAGIRPEARRHVEAKRLALDGIVSRGYLRYVWPSEPASLHYWAQAEAGRLGRAEQARSAELVATAEEDYPPIMEFLQRIGAAGCLDTTEESDQIVLPALHAMRKRSLDARALRDGDWQVCCAIRCAGGLPRRLAGRLAAKLMATARDCQLSNGLTVHTIQNNRLVVVQNAQAMELRVWASTQAVYNLLKEVRDCLQI